MKRNLLLLVMIAGLTSAWGCSGSESKEDDLGSADARVTDSTADIDKEDTVAPDGGADVTLPEIVELDMAPEDLGPADPLGFQLRKPQVQYSVDCSTGGGPGLFDDRDHVCTFAYGDWEGHIYFQATATDCFMLMGPSPTYSVIGAWMSLDGTVTPLDNPSYDIGGNHQNDFFEFDFEGQHFKYYHSTFGMGWRACQPMDCLQILAGEEIVEDGCLPKDRSLPIICVPVEADGTYAELVDTFAPCALDQSWK